MQENECEYCKDTEGDEDLSCGAQSDTVPRYHCTRPKGHEGPHVACTAGGHNLDSWVVMQKIRHASKAVKYIELNADVPVGWKSEGEVQIS